MEFCIPQSIATRILDATCCKVDMLGKALNQEAMTCHSIEDPLEAILICCHVISSHIEEKEEYARLLNESVAYT